MYLITYAGQDKPARSVPLRVPTTRYERKWWRDIEPATRTRKDLEEFNRHGLKVFRDRGMPEEVRKIVKDVADRHRVTVMLLASDSRMRIAVRSRNEAIYLSKQSRPKLSMPNLGRWFNRDHTSCLHSIASHQDLRNLPKLVGYDIKRVRERNAEISAKARGKASS